MVSPVGACQALLFHHPPAGGRAPRAGPGLTAADECPAGGVFGRYVPALPGQDPVLA